LPRNFRVCFYFHTERFQRNSSKCIPTNITLLAFNHTLSGDCLFANTFTLSHSIKVPLSHQCSCARVNTRYFGCIVKELHQRRNNRSEIMFLTACLRCEESLADWTSSIHALIDCCARKQCESAEQVHRLRSHIVVRSLSRRECRTRDPTAALAASSASRTTQVLAKTLKGPLEPARGFCRVRVSQTTKPRNTHKCQAAYEQTSSVRSICPHTCLTLLRSPSASCGATVASTRRGLPMSTVLLLSLAAKNPTACYNCYLPRVSRKKTRTRHKISARHLPLLLRVLSG